MRSSFRSVALILAAASLALVSSRSLGAQAAKPAAKPAQAAPAAKHVILNTADLKWGPAPPGLPAGSQVAVVEGDPSKAVPFVLRVKFPDGYRVPPHWHPTAEHLTVLSGTLLAGMGDTLDANATTALSAGGYVTMGSRMHHFVIAKGATEIQVHAVGPFTITYVNPKDDPRAKTSTPTQ